MSEKPEALRFETSLPYANCEILRVTNSGEFIWNENADQMIAQESSPHIAHLFRALRRAEAVQAENERLREALKLALNSHGRMLMSDPPQDAWKFNRVDEVINAALRRED